MIFRLLVTRAILLNLICSSVYLAICWQTAKVYLEPQFLQTSLQAFSFSQEVPSFLDRELISLLCNSWSVAFHSLCSHLLHLVRLSARPIGAGEV